MEKLGVENHARLLARFTGMGLWGRDSMIRRKLFLVREDDLLIGRRVPDLQIAGCTVLTMSERETERERAQHDHMILVLISKHIENRRWWHLQPHRKRVQMAQTQGRATVINTPELESATGKPRTRTPSIMCDESVMTDELTCHFQMKLGESDCGLGKYRVSVCPEVAQSIVSLRTCHIHPNQDIRHACERYRCA
jgi:hypothetical protein